MRSTTAGLFVMAAGLAAGGCAVSEEQILAPDLAHVARSAAVGAMVTGSGHYWEPIADHWRTFSFTAREMPGGDVKGRFSGGVHGGGRINHWSGRVVCLEVDGNVAWIGAIYEHAPINTGLVGRGFVFKVVDNGEGGLAPPDSISRAMRGGAECTNRPEPGPAFFYEVAGGDVQIHP